MSEGKIGKSTISTTGHSLGGGLAALAAGRWGMTANTFNAAGIAKATLRRYKVDSSNFAKVNAYYVKGEILTSLQQFTILANANGNSIPLTPSGSQSSWYTHPAIRAKRSAERHFISEVRASLEGN